jgi:Tfp pilus assembly protein PilO
VNDTSLYKRIVVEKRALIVPLAVALLANLAILGLAVFPLSAKVHGAEERAEAARRELLAAEHDSEVAAATLRGKTAAANELEEFYAKVLPANLTAARRITFLRLPKLARDVNLKFERRLNAPEVDRAGRLTKLKIQMVLEGQYENVRKFLYQLETANEFIVLDDVALVQGTQPNSPLVLTLELSTYFRAGGDGS